MTLELAYTLLLVVMLAACAAFAAYVIYRLLRSR